MNNRIFLIGFMGVGKTTIGKQLARKLTLPFVDIDQEIEMETGETINSIFEKYGEEAFRKWESETLLKMIEKYPSAIVSVGGGLPCYFNNMKLMNELGITCYLHRPAKELFQRLKNSKTERPLIKNLNDSELLRFIEKSLLKREEYYQQAQFTFLRNQQTVEYIKKTLIDSL